MVEVKMFYAMQLLGAKSPSFVYDLTGRSFAYGTYGTLGTLVLVILGIPGFTQILV